MPVTRPHKVDVYYNLRTGTWSVKDRKTGRVVRHPRVVLFPQGADFIVSQAGRAKVLENGVKNVHAFVRGVCPDYGIGEPSAWNAWRERDAPNLRPVTYNPQRAGTFQTADTREPVTAATSVVMIAEAGKPPRLWVTF